MRRIVLVSLACLAATMASAILVNPQTFVVVRGSVVSGNLSSVFSSDDNRLVVRKGPAVTGYSTPLEIQMTAICSTPTPQRLVLHFETKTDAAGLLQYVQMWEWSSNSWIDLDTRPLALTDQPGQVEVPLCWRFAKPVTGEMRMRFWVGNQGPASAGTWTVSIDRMVWDVDP